MKIMKKKKTFSRRDALKRMSKTALAIASVTMLPKIDALASDGRFSTDYTNACYYNYSNYDNYQNYENYYNYENYHNYSNYSNYYNCQ